MNLDKLKAIWAKWGWYVVLVLAVIVAYQLIKKPDVQVVTQTVIKEKVVTKMVTKIQYVEKKVVDKNVVTTTKVIENRKPTGELIITTETKTEDKTKVNVAKADTTTAVVAQTVQVAAIQNITTTTVSKRWWLGTVFYEFRGERIVIAPGINLWDNLSILAIGSYAAGGTPSFDYGIGIATRF